MPILWVRIASAGSPPERYTLQVPFQLGPTHSFTDAESNELSFGDHDLEILENQGIHLLRVRNFSSREQAEQYFQRLLGSLLWLTVRRRLSLRTVTELQTLQLKDPPIEVQSNSDLAGPVHNEGWTHIDGFVDPTPAVVIPEHLRIVEYGTGSVRAQMGTPVQSILESIVEGLAMPQPEEISRHEKLSLAIDLYAASLWETSQSAQVVSLSTALEALVTSGRVSTAASDLLDRLIEIFDSERNQNAEERIETRELNRMRSRLINLKRESISERLRLLAKEHASVLGQTSDEAARSVVSAYTVRSSLVHEGYADENEIKAAAEWLREAVPAILKSLAEQASRGRTHHRS